MGPVTPKSAAYQVAAADKGVLFDLTGSFALTLPPVAGASASAPLYHHFRKRDGSGRCTVVPSGSDTFATGAAFLALYQESLTLISFGGPWYAPPGARERVVNTGYAAVVSGAASVTVSAMLSDPDLSEIEVEVSGLTPSGATTFSLTLTQGGANGALVGNVQAYTTTQSSGQISGSSVTITPNGNSAIVGSIILKNLQATAARSLQFITNFAGSSASTMAQGSMSAAGAATAVTLTPASGIISAGSVNTRITRS